MFVLTRGRKVIIGGLLVNLLVFAVWSGIKYYLDHTTVVPEYGGEYIEGVIGKPVNLNPLVAVSDVDRDVCSLIFAGLTQIDQTGKLVGDLAKSWEISADKLTYTFFLRDDVLWHDGEPFTSADVAFSLSLVTDINYPGPFTIRNNWLGVGVEIVDEHTISFTLADPNSAFLENTTLGIVPKHLLEGTEISKLAEINFNREPVGLGMFKFEKVTSVGEQVASLTLVSNPDYWGKIPFIDKITLKFFDNEQDLFSAYRKHQVLGMHEFQTADRAEVKELKNTNLFIVPLPRYQAIFINNQSGLEFLKNQNIRKALSLGIDKQQIIDEILMGASIEADGPLTSGSWAYAPLAEDIRTYDPDKAKEMLTSEGWEDRDGDGIREKDDIRLSFSVMTDGDEDRYNTAFRIAEMWREIGVEVDVRPFAVGTFVDEYLRTRNFDSVLFGQSLSWDPDIYAYWHSSQADDPGMNISKYSNSKVDKLLEDARRLTDATERNKKYKEIQQIIRDEAPVLFLNSPQCYYAVQSTVKNVTVGYMIRPSDRFKTIATWYMETKRVEKVVEKQEKVVDVQM